MNNRFASFIAKPKNSSKEGGGTGTAKSSSNSATSACTKNNSFFSYTSNNTSKSRVNKPAAGSSQSPVKRVLKSPFQATSTKKPGTANHMSKRSLPLQSSTSDAQCKNFISKNKVAKCSKSPAVAKSSTTKNLEESAKTNNYCENTDGSNLQKVAETLAANDEHVPHEGPVDIGETDFDFYSVLLRPKSWHCEEDEPDAKSSTCSANETKTSLPTAGESSVLSDVPFTSSQSYSIVRRHESEIWGDLRTSSAETSSSTPPSLTSITDDELKTSFDEDDGLAKGSTEETVRDENNNMLENIKNPVCCRSITSSEAFHSPTRTPTASTLRVEISESERKDTVVDYNEENGPASFSTSKDLDQINESEGKINAQLSINSNIHISPLPEDIVSPLKIDVQLNEFSPPDSTQQDLGCRLLENQQCLRTNLENVDKVLKAKECPSVAATPPLATEIKPEEIRNSSSQLILNELNRETVDHVDTEDEFNDHQSQHIPISAKSSYISAAADEFFYADTILNYKELDSQQTQTESVASSDAGTDIDKSLCRDNRRQEKILSLVMAVNTGVDISSSEKENKSKLRGILKACQPESVHIDEMPDLTKHPLKFAGETNRGNLPLQKITYPQTFSQVGADYGFPAEISISGIIGKILTMTWASTDKRRVEIGETVTENEGANNIPISTVVGRNKGSQLISTAYDILNTGLKYASDLIGAERELEPREDWLRYNGYNIRVCGKRLLLESLHVNCDFNVDSNGICCRSNHSFMSLRSALSREELGNSREGRRVRIVVRVTGPFADDEEAVRSMKVLTHNIRHTDGKWTFIYENGENRDNFIEIGCPTGVHPESLAYGVLNGLILVDAP